MVKMVAPAWQISLTLETASTTRLWKLRRMPLHHTPAQHPGAAHQRLHLSWHRLAEQELTANGEWQAMGGGRQLTAYNLMCVRTAGMMLLRPTARFADKGLEFNRSSREFQV